MSTNTKSLLQSAITAHEHGGLSEDDRQALIANLREQAAKPSTSPGKQSDYTHAADVLASGTHAHQVERAKVRHNLATRTADAPKTEAKPEKTTPAPAPAKPGLLARLKGAKTTRTLNELAIEIAEDVRLDGRAILALLRKHGALDNSTTHEDLSRMAMLTDRALGGKIIQLRRYADMLEQSAKRLPAVLRQESQRVIDAHNTEQPEREAAMRARTTKSWNAQHAEQAKRAESDAKRRASASAAQADREFVLFKHLRDSLRGV